MSTAVPPGTCVTHGWHGMTVCPRCSTAVGPFTPLGRFDALAAALARLNTKEGT